MRSTQKCPKPMLVSKGAYDDVGLRSMAHYRHLTHDTWAHCWLSQADVARFRFMLHAYGHAPLSRADWQSGACVAALLPPNVLLSLVALARAGE